MMKTIASTLLTLGLLALSPAAHAAGEGTAVGVNPDATARINSTDRILQAGADVSVGELIVTGPQGQVQIVFDDQTRLVVGPGSSLLIETYLLSSGNTAQKLAINALGGSFRFISGNSPKSAYSIKTPTAAIAVRGTEFDLLVASSFTAAMLYEGALQLCARSGDCEELVDRCDLGTAESGATDLLILTDPAHRPLAQQFRYARFQSPLLSAFRVEGAIFCTEDRAVIPPSFSSGQSGDNNQTQTQTQNPEPTPPPNPLPTPIPTPGPFNRN